MAIKKAFADFYSGKIDPLFNIHDMDKNFLVFDLSNETKFSRYIIIPSFHVQNYHEAKAFAAEVVRNLDTKFCLAVDLGVYKSLQNLRLFMNHKVGSSRVKQYKSHCHLRASNGIQYITTLGSFITLAKAGNTFQWQF